MSANLTMTDLFCGAGGSSTGAVSVPGVSVRLAANHWDKAIETHNTNHPDVDHLQADISNTDPRYVPTTDLLWASPECTNHSRAKGRKAHRQPDLFGDVLPDEAAERSRATMWDVVRFAETHHYRAVLVENVVEVVDWSAEWGVKGGLFRSWLGAMHAMGYRHRIVSLNAMHAQAHGLPAPQSRDRVYIAFWREGERAPDFEHMQRPRAYCPRCDEVVNAMQWWKKGNGQDRPGRYRSQYLYRCPNTACRNEVVEPAWLPASSIIDWSNPGTRIGDRDKPLAEKTMRRIQVGIERYWSPILAEHGGNPYDAADPKHPGFGNPASYYRAWPITDPTQTMHTRESKGLAYHPLMVPVEGREGKEARIAAEAARTMTTRNETALALPPFLAELRGGGSTARAASDPLATVTASGNHHGLVMPYYGTGRAAPTDEALSTVTTLARHALIHRNNGGGAEMTTPASEPVRTVTTAGHQSLLTGGTVNIDDVRFRMLEPDEIKQAMAFPADYVMVGNRREQVKLSGNAVCPPAARDLVATVVSAITGEDVAR
ncbi:DNA cytosine methyltransferase [Cellulosimicrobium sp. XJ-DQ-B-000]|uniref:DNA cytosine methyltransferase n=1 Tax=Cellulosimicrobium sp. XJ-DQ-B-000 TaxID=3072182 RepID=UPI0028099FB9|nr:DNA cytosine methyltransferase [Cellulosimicrobium sp. XJ-DQ-B-000]MDQ8040611.1 DNA cytosine methyltransferase [Cellulosimicrobium sp. XJ-DQ-B-000]